MKSTRVLVVFFGILLSIGLLGCGGGGGGGGGGTAAPDAPAITARLNSFVKAMAHGNVVEATKFMSSRLAAASGGVYVTWDDPHVNRLLLAFSPDGILLANTEPWHLVVMDAARTALVNLQTMLAGFGKMQVEGLGEFCCSSRPLRLESPAEKSEEPRHA